MVYLGIAFVILLIIAPIVALLPSARQREQMALRQAARSAGLRTELTTIEDPAPDPDKYISVTGKALPRELKCIAYRCARQRPAEWRRLPAFSWAVIRSGQPSAAGTMTFPDGWQWLEPLPETAAGELRHALTRGLETLPDDVIRVDEEHYVVSVYWRENGGMEAFERIEQVLGDLARARAQSLPRDDEDDELLS